MRKTKKFDMFGKHYRVTQFSAARALELMAIQEAIHPTVLLSGTEVMDGNDWIVLDEANAINSHVADAAGALPPSLVLRSLCNIIDEFSFGFLANWKGVKVPNRFKDPAQSVVSANVDPMIATLTQDNQTSIRELEEYYSLEDAFKMFDVIMMKGVNTALSHEAAEKRAKAKAR